ncbi:carbohydrate-binding protein [Microbacterium sp. PMB16]|uniref:carbohydrate-binding protein n=1 Tax=Microbacterium sp. PMB16 TaxID=3120157 RepID=UPI003F4BD5AA
MLIKKTHPPRTLWLAALAVLAASAAPLAGATAASASTPCSASWSADTVYVGGETVAIDGSNYTAQWWTQNEDPRKASGDDGSGMPWKPQGACSGSVVVVPPVPAPVQTAPVVTPPEVPSTPADSTPAGVVPDKPRPAEKPGQTSTRSAADFSFSPYKDITRHMDWNTNDLQSAASGSVKPLTGAGSTFADVPGLNSLTLAFATGSCANETWAGVDKAAMKAQVAKLSAAGVDYTISTGGAAGAFTCASQADFNTFVNTYAGPHLRGIDFDLEGGQTASQVESLVAVAKGAEEAYPNLRFSFTIATLAASDGSFGGVNELGAQSIKAIERAGLKNYTINLMTMDFGPASAGNCVVVGTRCDMAASTIQAVKNLQHTFGIDAKRIEVTPMIGVNDVTDEVVSIKDIAVIADYAKKNLAGLHIWSLDRDTPSAVGAVSETGSGTAEPALAFTKRILSIL